MLKHLINIKIPTWELKQREDKLYEFSLIIFEDNLLLVGFSYPTKTQQVFWHNFYLISVDGTQIEVQKSTNKMCLWKLLNGQYGRYLLVAGLEVEGQFYLPDNPHKGKSMDKEVRGSLVSLDILQGTLF